MFRWMLFIAAALALLWWADSVKADDLTAAPEVKMGSVPVVCMGSETFSKKITEAKLFPLWQGMNGHEYLTTLWQVGYEKGWLITVQRAGNPLVCIVSAGDDSGFVGDEAQL